jgi:hypothetical protein
MSWSIDKEGIDGDTIRIEILTISLVKLVWQRDSRQTWYEQPAWSSQTLEVRHYQ